MRRWVVGLVLVGLAAAVRAAEVGPVLDAEHRPVEGARVVRLRAGQHVGEPATTGADGRATLPDAAPGEYLLVVAAGAGLAVASAPWGQPIRLTEATGLNVPFLQPDGAPAAGLRVRVSAVFESMEGDRDDGWRELPDLPELTTATGADGLARFDGLPRTTALRLDPDDPRYARLSPEEQPHTGIDDGRRATAIHLRRAAELGGRIVDRATGVPVGGLPVVWTWGYDAVRTVSAADGTWRLTRLRPARGALAVELGERRRRAAATLLPVDLGEGETLTGLELALIPGVPLFVTVLAADGQPAQGCLVRLGQPELAWPTLTRLGEFPVGPDGAEVHLLPGTYSVGVVPPPTGPRYAHTPGAEVDAREGQPLFLVLRLPLPAAEPWMALQAVDADGRPVAGAEVAVLGLGGSRRTGPDGRCAWRWEYPEPAVVWAQRDGQSSGEPRTLQAGVETVLRLIAEPGRLAVPITDEHGRPLAGATASLMGGFPSSRYGVCLMRSARSGPDGLAVFEGLPAGLVYSLRASATGYGIGYGEGMPAPLLAGEMRALKPVRLARATGVLAGWVLAPDGRLVPGVKVMAIHEAGAGQTGRTDAQGEFRFTGLAPGKVTVQVFSDAWAGLLETVVGEENAVVRVKAKEQG